MLETGSRFKKYGLLVGCVLALTIFCFTLGACASLNNYKQEQTKKVQYEYYIVPDEFSISHEALIVLGGEHISESVSCVEFVRVPKYTPGKTIRILDMGGPQYNKKTERYNIGLYYFKSKNLKLSKESPDKKGNKPMVPEKFYKVLLHEFAHAMGMRGHQFPEEKLDVSQLTPIISDDSNPSLYPDDIAYLESLVCKSENK